MSATDYILLVLKVASPLVVLVGVVVMHRHLLVVQRNAAKVQEDARKLQDQAESMMRGSTPHAVIVDECQEADDVDDMLAEVIELSNKKRRRMAREMRKRQRKIERELAE